MYNLHVITKSICKICLVQSFKSIFQDQKLCKRFSGVFSEYLILQKEIVAFHCQYCIAFGVTRLMGQLKLEIQDSILHIRPKRHVIILSMRCSLLFNQTVWLWGIERSCFAIPGSSGKAYFSMYKFYSRSVLSPQERATTAESHHIPVLCVDSCISDMTFICLVSFYLQG